MSAHESSVRILHVEDSRTEAFMIKRLLETAGVNRYHITQADTFAKAKATLSQESFDIVLLDLSLPDAQGIDLLHAIAEIAPTLPVVVVTGEEDQEFGLQVMREGAQSCLIKGKFKPQILYDAIDHALEQKEAEVTHTFKIRKVES